MDRWPTRQAHPGWRNWDRQAVIDLILARAGGPDVGAIEQTLEPLRESFSDLKEQAIALLTAALSKKQDPFLDRKLKQIEPLKIADARTIELSLLPKGRYWTRDSQAMSQGLRPAPHQSLIALTLSATVLEDGLDSVEKAARQAASHLQRIQDYAAPIDALPGSQKVTLGMSVSRAAIPDQSPAPVRVEERDGKIARVSDRDSPLNALELDFNAWREPIVDHIQELSSGDFRLGTNHSRVRDRLVALGEFLPGSIAEVKERQFRIGYEIDRLEGLVLEYRSGADDMPVLNAAVLEDLDRLRLALLIGIDKLERWTEFRRAAASDPMREGSADPVVISEALNDMAAEMERLPKYFEPEIPETFRFMAEAARDPRGATKTIVYGGVRSAENVLSFLGQRALGVGKSAVGAVEQHISKAVAISLITVLSGAALSISGALPAGLAWLKPLLDALAKPGGG